MSKVSTPVLRAHFRAYTHLASSITTHCAPTPLDRRGQNISEQQRLARGRIGAKYGGASPMYTVARKRRKLTP